MGTFQQTHLEEDRTGKRREAEVRADGSRMADGGRRTAMSENCVPTGQPEVNKKEKNK
jgi:hypothetical protein